MAVGQMKQKLNRQDTKHGALDLPVANLKKYQGYSGGGMAKKRKFADGGDVSIRRQIAEDKERAASARAYEKEGTKSKMGEGKKLSTVEKVLSYPARVAILGGSALGAAGDQALYDMGARSSRFSQSTKDGKGYQNAKKLGRAAVGIDSLDGEDNGMKKGGSVARFSSGGQVGRGDGIAQRGKTRGAVR